jgi:hypothetical protein
MVYCLKTLGIDFFSCRDLPRNFGQTVVAETNMPRFHEPNQTHGAVVEACEILVLATHCHGFV